MIGVGLLKANMQGNVGLFMFLELTQNEKMSNPFGI